MTKYTLEMTLKSDTTFGRGDGVAGLIDAEVEHDECGLPFLRGRALKGLLVEECANLLFAFEKQQVADFKKWRDAADFLFGKPGSRLDDDANMFVSDCKLPDDLHDALAQAIADKRIEAEEVLKSLTTIRRQTAIDAETGAPKEPSLRSMRVVIRENSFTSNISFSKDLSNKAPGEEVLALLSFCARGLRRVGLGRNRGRGKVSVRLLADGKEIDYFTKFPVKGTQTK